jgi:hypothetical protein
LSAEMVLALAAAAASIPVSAPPVFVGGKAVTFRSPKGALICRLSKDWIGSDHGTTLFLERPKRCNRQGFPSSERSYRGSPAIRRIEVFCAYWMGDDEPHFACHKRGTMLLMGKARPLCASVAPKSITLWSQARYTADAEAAITISLVTRRSTMAKDLRLFQRWAATVRPCRVQWTDTDGKNGAYGPAPNCPKRGVFF